LAEAQHQNIKNKKFHKEITMQITRSTERNVSIQRMSMNEPQRLMKKSKNQIRILLVDTDRAAYRAIQKLLDRIQGDPFWLDWVDTYDNALEAINSRSHDIYLVDYEIDERNGLELITEADAFTRNEPFIMLTNAGNEQIERLAMQLGVADYLVKGKFDSELLSRTMRYALLRKQLEKERVQYLVELNKTKDEFISLASHQLRTPATGVKQYIGMILEGFLGPISHDQNEMLTRAYQSNERQLQIVNDLLQVARADAGRVSLDTKPTNLRLLVDDIVDGCRSIFGGRNQSVRVDSPANAITADVDKDQLRMVVENIIDNASKYSEEGTEIRVRLSKDERSTNIAISDQGVGISPADQKRLFQKFSRIDNAQR
jgi:two-component system sensor histidine kinase/response regulator